MGHTGPVRDSFTFTYYVLFIDMHIFQFQQNNTGQSVSVLVKNIVIYYFLFHSSFSPSMTLRFFKWEPGLHRDTRAF